MGKRFCVVKCPYCGKLSVAHFPIALKLCGCGRSFTVNPKSSVSHIIADFVTSKEARDYIIARKWDTLGIYPASEIRRGAIL